jgi:hypothetical protein
MGRIVDLRDTLITGIAITFVVQVATRNMRLVGATSTPSAGAPHRTQGSNWVIPLG